MTLIKKENGKEIDVCDKCYDEYIIQDKWWKHLTIGEKLECISEHWFESLYSFNGIKSCYKHKIELELQWWKEKQKECISIGGERDRYPLLLNSYQALNLRWALYLAWRGLVPQINTGDWVGEIPQMLDEFIKQYGETFSSKQANQTFEEFFQSYFYKKTESFLPANKNKIETELLKLDIKL